MMMMMSTATILKTQKRRCGRAAAEQGEVKCLYLAWYVGLKQLLPDLYCMRSVLQSNRLLVKFSPCSAREKKNLLFFSSTSKAPQSFLNLHVKMNNWPLLLMRLLCKKFQDKQNQK